MHMQVQDVSDLMTNKMLALKRELNIYMTLRQSDPAKVINVDRDFKSIIDQKFQAFSYKTNEWSDLFF